MGHTLRERAKVWEEGKEIKRRAAWELQVLVSEAINRRLDREMTEMAFKGSRPGKGSGGKGKDDKADVLAMYRELVRVQSEVIHALAAALAATEVEGEEDEDEEDEDEEKGEDKE